LAHRHPSSVFHHPSVDLTDLPSFPTRRSSDLLGEGDDAELPEQVLDRALRAGEEGEIGGVDAAQFGVLLEHAGRVVLRVERDGEDRKSTRLNSSHVKISYAVFCLKKKNILVNT